jgi:cathepsin B
MEDCSLVPTVAPLCLSSCPSNTGIVYANDKTQSLSNYGFGGDVVAIQNDIMAYGSVSAAFTVYEDFLTYSGGVYYHQTGASLGGHAIKMYGWGFDAVSGMNYWMCMNSWNNTWGVNGGFWIEMGNCGINNEVNAGLA